MDQEGHLSPHGSRSPAEEEAERVYESGDGVPQENEALEINIIKSPMDSQRLKQHEQVCLGLH